MLAHLYTSYSEVHTSVCKNVISIEHIENVCTHCQNEIIVMSILTIHTFSADARKP